MHGAAVSPALDSLGTRLNGGEIPAHPHSGGGGGGQLSLPMPLLRDLDRNTQRRSDLRLFFRRYPRLPNELALLLAQDRACKMCHKILQQRFQFRTG